MKYELAKQLKDAGFPQRWGNSQTIDGCVYDRPSKNRAHVPDLSELIAGCGDGFHHLKQREGVDPHNKWEAGGGKDNHYALLYGDTPEEAVANIWLALHKKTRR